MNKKTLFQRNAGQSSQTGFVLISVVLMLAMLATIAFMLNQQSSVGVNAVNSEIESDRARYVAEAGLAHSAWALQSSSCSGDITLPAVPFGASGSDNYRITVTAGGSTTSYTLDADQDAWFRSDDATLNNGSAVDLHIRNDLGIVEYGLVRFDLSALPANAIINSAEASFYIESTKGHPEGAIAVHKTRSDWTETDATWDTMATKADTTVLDMIAPQPQVGENRVRVNLTAQVQSWVNGDPNYGVMLIPLSDGTHAEYSSREGAASQQPRLEVIVGNGNSVSPANISVTGTLASGVNRTLNRPIERVYQPGSYTILQPGAANGQDAEIYAQQPTNNYGAARENWVSSVTNDTTRSLLRFNMGVVPAGAKVTAATLSLYRQSGSGADQPVSAHRILNAWSEDRVSWEKREAFKDWDTDGGDFEPTAVATTLVGPVNGRYEWDVGSLVQGWVDGSYPNYGVMMIAAAPGMAGERFNTSDHGNSSKWPSLSITYACECGTSCLVPQGAGKILLISNSSISNAVDLAKAEILRSWGYEVNLAHHSFLWLVNFNDYDAVYVSEFALESQVGSQLTNLAIGVVYEQGSLNSKLGLASGVANPVGGAINVVDNNHYITRPFASGTLPIYVHDMEGLAVSGAEAVGLQTLAEWGNAGGLAVVDTGAALGGDVNGESAAGRRVMLPLGRASAGKFNWDHLNANGRVIVQRALSWSQGYGCTESTRRYRIRLGVNDAEEFKNDTMYLNSTDLEFTKDPEFGGEAQFIGLRFTDIDIPQGTVITQASLELVADEVDSASTSLVIVGHDIDHSDEFKSDNRNISKRIETEASVPWTDVPAWTTVGELHASPDISGIVQEIVDRTGWSSGNALSLIVSGTGDRVAFAYESSVSNAALLSITACNLPGGDLGPVAHWPLDEIDGIAAEDIDSNHNGALIKSPQWKPGQLNGGLAFNGVDQSIEVEHNNALSLVNEMSFSAWVKTSDVSAGNRAIVSTDVPGNGASNFWFGTIQDELAFGFWANGRFAAVQTDTANLQTGRFYHLAATFDNASNSVLLYVDGVLTAKGELTDDPTVESANVLIGASADDEYWHGTLDDVRIYPHALDETAVTELAIRTARGPIAHWMLNETTGVTAVDTAGHHDAELINGPSWASAKIDGGLRYDGSNDHVTVPHHSYLSLDDAFTITAWVNNESPSISGSYRIISKESSGSNDNYWLSLQGGRLFLGIGGGFFGPVGNFDPNKWYHLAATFDDANDNVRIYIDGSEVLNQTTSVKLTANAEPLMIGANWQSTKYWHGLLDDIRIYDTALTDAAIAAIASGLVLVIPEKGGILDSIDLSEGGSGGCNGTFRDEFNRQDYGQNNGSLEWSGSWIETGETTSATSGDIRIDNDEGNYQLQVRDDGQTIARELNLSTAGSAILSFDYRRQSLVGSGDYVAIEVSYDGGSKWQEIDRFEGSATDRNYIAWSEKLESSSLSKNTQIRFLTPSSGMSNTTKVWFDNIEIACSP